MEELLKGESTSLGNVFGEMHEVIGDLLTITTDRAIDGGGLW